MSEVTTEQEQPTVVEQQQPEDSSEGHYSDQKSIDAECERLLRNTKKQVKQMMEEAVTRKFIHEESSTIISLCVSVDACLSHGLKRRALGLFKTNSSTALIQKVAKGFPVAQEILDMVGDEERRAQSLQQQQRQRQQATARLSSSANYQDTSINKSVTNQKSPIKQVIMVASNSGVHKRNMWIKCALIEKKLVNIVEHLSENSSKYYEPDALMANYLCAQILSSLLVGPSALEFRRSKNNDFYHYEDPTANELLERHKLANPIACLCNVVCGDGCSQATTATKPPVTNTQAGEQPVRLSQQRSATTDNSGSGSGSSSSNSAASLGRNSHRKRSSSATVTTNADKTNTTVQSDTTRRSPSPQCQAVSNRKQHRRRPLSLKTNVKRGTLVTDCHHYSCQEMSEHQQTRGYSILCASSNAGSFSSSMAPQNSVGSSVVTASRQTSASANSQLTNGTSTHTSGGGGGGGSLTHDSWSLWSPRMLHETLHQNPKSCLLYAKNNVLLETPTHETLPGYLSLHQTSSDLILKWIPNQMINGSQVATATTSHQRHSTASESQPPISPAVDKINDGVELTPSDNIDSSQSNLPSNNQEQQQQQQQHVCDQPVAVESSYLELVVSLSVSRIVLLHCQFGRLSRHQHHTGQINGDQPPPPPPTNGYKGSPDATDVTDDRQDAETPTATTNRDQQHNTEIEPSTNQEALNHQIEVRDSSSHSARVTSTEETLILVEADGVQRAPFKFPKGGLRLFLSCLESGLRPNKYLDPAIRFDDNLPDGDHQVKSLNRLHSSVSGSNGTAGSNGLDSPSASSEPSGSRLEIFLKRLPSLKRKSPKPPAETTGTTDISRIGSPELVLGGDSLVEGRAADYPMCSNYVYRIVSLQQPDWPLPTPPHSAFSIGSSSSGSFGLVGQSFVHHYHSTNTQQQQHQHQQQQPSSSGQKFRWSLSRLARFSARYTTNSVGSTSSTTSGGQQAGNSRTEVSSSSPSYNRDQTLESNNSIGDETTSISTVNNTTDNHSRELARVEAKLDHLKESTSDHILALRTQSIQTLCDSMRKQILARAFYGWLVHCRRARIIRTHLTKLVKNDDCLLIDAELCDDEQYERLEELKLGLTSERWQCFMERRKELDEAELCSEINLLVYYGGIENDKLRKEVWPYLLGHYKYRDSPERRRLRDEQAREAYEACARDWIQIERVVKQRDSELLAANIAKASGNRNPGKENKEGALSSSPAASTLSKGSVVDSQVDSNNNQDKSQELVDSTTLDEQAPAESDEVESTLPSIEGENINKSACSDDAGDSTTQSNGARKAKNIKLAAKRRRMRAPRLESTGSVGSDASITDQFGNNIHRIDKDVQRCDRNFWYFKDTKNLDKLRNIMCSYVWQHLDVGYVQGMCDLAAPILVIFDDELLAYNCFSQLMKRMVANFPHGCAMDQHFESLKYLMQVLDPKLFEILQSNGDYTHFYFCYRWLLLDFKRELAYEDVFRVWETIWSARHVATDHFVVFMALAMVRYYRDIIIENNMDFTDTIKFFNEMAERHDAKKIAALARDCVVELQGLIKTV